MDALRWHLRDVGTVGLLEEEVEEGQPNAVGGGAVTRPESWQRMCRVAELQLPR